MSGAVSYTLDQVMEELKKMPAHPSPARLLAMRAPPMDARNSSCVSSRSPPLMKSRREIACVMALTRAYFFGL
jgi:hypothetical protein